jgi:hypothetical protein
MPRTAPLSLMYSPSGPLVAGTPFLTFHGQAVETMIGRRPSAFMRATAHSLWLAYVSRMPPEDKPTAYTAVSAATGSGKSLAACALLAYLVDHGHAVAYVVETIEAVEEVRGWLESLLPGQVAAATSIHRANAAPDKVRHYSEQGVTTEHRYTEDEFMSAKIVVTTHARWADELRDGKDRGVLKCSGVDRALVIVDEEPELQDVYQRRPEHVSELLSVLSSKALANEGRYHGFTEAHPSSSTLLTVHDRMHAVSGNLNVPQMLAALDLVTADDLKDIDSITKEDLVCRLGAGQWSAIEFLWGTVQFLKVASQGRVFYSKAEGGSFHAYGFRLPVKARHIVLDGTADLNGLYAVGSHVLTVEAERPNYAALNLFAVEPPKEFRGQMKPTGILKDAYRARSYLRWLFEFIEPNTSPGEQVLLYGKKALLSFGLHTTDEFNDSGTEDRNVTTYKGRTLHWVNMGRGRGLNRWKDCTVYIRLGDFHMRKDVAVATVGSITGHQFTDGELRSLSGSSSRNEQVSHVMETHLAVTNKQDAARTIIRNLGDDGACPPARAYMLDCVLPVLVKYHASMFPGAAPYELLGYTSVTRKESDGAAERVARLLLTTDLRRLTVADLAERGGMRAGHYARTVTTATVREAMSARGWREATRKDLGMSGKGKLLVRDALTAAA